MSSIAKNIPTTYNLDFFGMNAGSAAAFTVYEQETEEVTVLAGQLLAAAALTPGAVLDRLLEDAVLHSGQVCHARFQAWKCLSADATTT